MQRRGDISEMFHKGYIPVPECGCWIWLADGDKDGYGRMMINYKSLRAHRVSWLLHYGEIPNGLAVLHQCDTPSCVNPHHLFLGTSKDNMMDKTSKNRQSKGEKNGISKLTNSQVIEIFNSKESYSILANRYHVDNSNISCIKLGKTWKHLNLYQNQ